MDLTQIDQQPRVRFVFFILLVGLTIARLFTAAAVGLGDAEAYYWTWSTDLSLSYFDHGPAVALLIRAGTALAGGDSTLAVRLPFIVTSLITLLLMARLGGAWAALILLAMPMFLVAGGAANPDVPFIALVLGFLAALDAARRRGGTLPLLCLAGLLWGMAFSTKYLGLFLGVPLLQVAFSRRRGRLQAAALPCLLALAGALPVLAWNASRGWPTLAYHLGQRHTRPVGPSLENLGKLLGGQIGYLSPFILAGLVAAAWSLWGRKTHDPTARFLLLCAASLLLPACLLILLVPSAEPHWPAAGYLPLVIALGRYLPAWLADSRRGVRITTWLGAAFSALVAVIFHLHVLTDLGVRAMPASYVPRYDLSNELRGWPTVAEHIAKHTSPTPTPVAACHYTTCSQLAFAARGRFEVICPSPRRDQFDFSPTGDGSARRGINLLYLYDERFPFKPEQLYKCTNPRLLEKIQIHRAGRTVRNFKLYTCTNYQGLTTTLWPPSPPTKN